MAFLNDRLDEDLARLGNDLDLLMSDFRPTAIDIYPMMPRLDGDEETARQKVTALRRVLLERRISTPEYRLAAEASVRAFDEIEYADRYRNYFLVKMDPNEYFGSVKTYSCSDVVSAPTTQNTLGLGAMRAAKYTATSTRRRSSISRASTIRRAHSSIIDRAAPHNAASTATSAAACS